MVYDIHTNRLGEALVKWGGEKASMLDANNIVWKIVDGKWMGKRSVWTKDNRACWLEDTTKDNVKSWWCGGEHADYNEIFTA
jgi:hypothetical protein